MYREPSCNAHNMLRPGVAGWWGEGLSLRKGDTVQGLDAALDHFKNSKVNDKLHVSP